MRTCTSFIQNNPARYLESVSVRDICLIPVLTRVFYPKARIEWMMTLGNEMGGPKKAQAMVKGQGVSLILKSLSIKFKRPVAYPDTVSGLTTVRFSAEQLTCRSWLSSSLRTNRTFPHQCLARGLVSTVERRCTRTRNRRSWRNLIVSWCGMIMGVSRSATPDLRRGA